MATFLENAYSLVHQDNTADQPTLQELRTLLEKGNDESKDGHVERRSYPTASNAHHPFRYAVKKQTPQKAPLLLLRDMSQARL